MPQNQTKPYQTLFFCQSPVGWGGRIHRLFSAEEQQVPKNVLDTTLKDLIAQLAGGVEYTDCVRAEG